MARYEQSERVYQGTLLGVTSMVVLHGTAEDSASEDLTQPAKGAGRIASAGSGRDTAHYVCTARSRVSFDRLMACVQTVF